MDCEEESDEHVKGYVPSPEENPLPVISQEDDTKLKRKLLDEFVEAGAEKMKVYLRIRPFTAEEVRNRDNQGCLQVENTHTLIMKAPKDSTTFKNCSYELHRVQQKFTVSHIFCDKANQQEVFDGCVFQPVKNFIDGQNCLLFAYGITSSGKTYTMQGTPQEPGVIPRALDTLFNSIHGRQIQGIPFKPRFFSEVVRLTPKEEKQEISHKENLLKCWYKYEDSDNSIATNDLFCNFTHCNSTQSLYSEDSLNSTNISKTLHDSLEKTVDGERVHEASCVSVEEQGNILFSVWISFAEIYNECIFDLLEPLTQGRKRNTLRLAEDRNGNVYIKGLQEICVSSAEEACRLLNIGQKNLRIAATKLNQHSSRSHCIFSIRLVRVVDVAKPHNARISKLSFCDLAGSERCCKTHNTGERLKEAGNINTSLLVLGRCIEALRHNQLHKEKKVVPFRESKLTRLFQAFFTGKGQASMVVNVNQCASMYDETLAVMKFSSIARQIVTTDWHDPQKSSVVSTVVSRLTEAWAMSSHRWSSFSRGRQVAKASMSIMEEESLVEEEEVEEEDTGNPEESKADDVYQKLIQLVKFLEQELIDAKRQMARMEIDIREEVCQEYSELFVKIENTYNEHLRQAEENAEELMEKRLEIMQKALFNSRKRARMEDDFEASESFEIDKDPSEEIEALKKQLEQLKEELQTIRKENQKLTEDNTRIQFEKEARKHNLNLEIEKEEGFKKQLEELEIKFECVTKENAELLKQNSSIVGKNHDLKEQKERDKFHLLSVIQEQELMNSKVSTLENSVSTLISEKETLYENYSKLKEEYEKIDLIALEYKTEEISAELKNVLTEQEIWKCKSQKIEQELDEVLKEKGVLYQQYKSLENISNERKNETGSLIKEKLSDLENQKQLILNEKYKLEIEMKDLQRKTEEITKQNNSLQEVLENFKKDKSKLLHLRNAECFEGIKDLSENEQKDNLLNDQVENRKEYFANGEFEMKIAALQRENEDLIKKYSVLQEIVGNLKQEIVLLSDAKKKLQVELCDENNKISFAQKENEMFQSSVKEMQTTQDKLICEKQTLLSQMTHLEEEVARLNEKNDTFNYKLIEEVKNKSSVIKEKDKLKAKLYDLETEHEMVCKENRKIHLEMEKCSIELQNKSADVENLSSQIKNYQLEKQQLQEEKESIHREMMELKKLIETIKEEKSSLVKQAEELSSEKVHFMDKITTLQSDVTSLQEKIEIINKENNMLISEKEDLKIEKARNNEFLSHLTKNKEDIDSQLKVTKQYLQDISSQVENLKDENKNLKCQLDDVKIVFDGLAFEIGLEDEPQKTIVEKSQELKSNIQCIVKNKKKLETNLKDVEKILEEKTVLCECLSEKIQQREMTQEQQELHLNYIKDLEERLEKKDECISKLEAKMATISTEEANESASATRSSRRKNKIDFMSDAEKLKAQMAKLEIQLLEERDQHQVELQQLLELKKQVEEELRENEANAHKLPKPRKNNKESETYPSSVLQLKIADNENNVSETELTKSTRKMRKTRQRNQTRAASTRLSSFSEDDFEEPKQLPSRRRKRTRKQRQQEIENHNQEEQTVKNELTEDVNEKSPLKKFGDYLRGKSPGLGAMADKVINTFLGYNEENHSDNGDKQVKVEESSLVKRRKRQLYKENNIEPLNCSPQVENINSTSPHTIVRRKLRKRN